MVRSMRPSNLKGRWSWLRGVLSARFMYFFLRCATIATLQKKMTTHNCDVGCCIINTIRRYSWNQHTYTLTSVTNFDDKYQHSLPNLQSQNTTAAIAYLYQVVVYYHHLQHLYIEHPSTFLEMHQLYFYHLVCCAQRSNLAALQYLATWSVPLRM